MPNTRKRFVVIPDSTLVLIESLKGYRLFCASTSILFNCPVSTWEEAYDCAVRVSQEWSYNELSPADNIDKGICVTLCLTQNCNLSCQYCYLKGDYPDWTVNVNTQKDTLSTKVMCSEILDLIKTHPMKLTINFFGGEPTLHKNSVIEIAEYSHAIAQEHNVTLEIGLTTNGTRLDSSFLDWANRNNIRIMVSIDSPRELHDKYRARGNTKASYKEIMARIRGYEKDIIAVTTITHKTPSVMESLAPLLEVGFREVSFNLVHTRDPDLRCQAGDIEKYLLELERGENWFYANKKRIGNLKQIHDLIAKREIRMSPCSSGKNSYAITPEGRRYFCHSCAGNPIFELDLQKRPVSEELKSYQASKINRSYCANCWAYRICGGECWLIQWKYKTKEKTIRCELVRGIIRLALSIYD